jgi:hypothetical protein
MLDLKAPRLKPSLTVRCAAVVVLFGLVSGCADGLPSSAILAALAAPAPVGSVAPAADGSVAPAGDKVAAPEADAADRQSVARRPSSTNSCESAAQQPSPMLVRSAGQLVGLDKQTSFQPGAIAIFKLIGYGKELLAASCAGSQGELKNTNVSWVVSDGTLTSSLATSGDAMATWKLPLKPGSYTLTVKVYSLDFKTSVTVKPGPPAPPPHVQIKSGGADAGYNSQTG